MAIFDIHNNVNMITRNRIGKNSNAITLCADPQPFPILVTFPAEPEKKPAIMTPVCQMIEKSILQIGNLSVIKRKNRAGDGNPAPEDDSLLCRPKPRPQRPGWFA